MSQDLECLARVDLAGDHQHAEGLVDDGSGGQGFLELLVQRGLPGVAEQDAQRGRCLRGEGLGAGDVGLGEGMGRGAEQVDGADGGAVKGERDGEGAVDALCHSVGANTAGTGATVHGYRIRHEHGQITEFSSLPEVATYLHARFDEATCEALVSDFVMAFSKSRRTAGPPANEQPAGDRVPRR